MCARSCSSFSFTIAPRIASFFLMSTLLAYVSSARISAPAADTFIFFGREGFPK
jgi:hypothetical protein